jgi:hypothetical protein
MAEVGLIWADDADLTAIYRYVEGRRPDLATHPQVQPLIDSFEAWYQGLSWYDVHVMINDTISEASRRRNEINAAFGDIIDPTVIPADRLVNKPGSGGTLPGVKPVIPIIPPWFKYGAALVGAATIVLSAVTFAGVKAYKP